MKVYHQTGFRFNWNIECFQQNVGDGLIFSPINIEADKLLQLDNSLKETSFLDPQLYLLNEAKGTLCTYPYFPGNIKPDFSTPDLENSNEILAQLCIDYQLKNNFEYIVIPTRYHVDNPTTYFLQTSDYFVSPFIDYLKTQEIKKKVLQSVIVKTIMLTDEDKRNETLNWITGQPIDGVYLIFEDNSTGKQIKDFDFLLNALIFIHILKINGMEVHLGYTNTEAILYSIAMPDSVTIGSYENLRSFGIKRFQDLENGPMRAPRARLYSSHLLQWLDYQYIEAMSKLIDDYENYFDDSEYKPLMFKPDYNWQFMKPEPYKHYFYVFNKQIKGLPETQFDRIEFLKASIRQSLILFKKIEETVLLDDDSNGSHLPNWFNVINAFQKELSL
ncbi:MAG TPA: hypothetical protein PLN06_05860 [Bacteroidales bacterium]|nr:hypothetical protein [Bacteroidales bacterium]HCI57833.1 hypothetical protein [Bacteroidota bacterium]HOU96138.1 hypothetical protein [Bacteroidales bacterium]HQG37180.1 hypothetical protein [Bacteroidales bacterium]HQG53443.1 hypothetical protein [Bacteroidales bacterium]